MKSFLITAFVLLATVVCLNAQSPVLYSYFEIKDALVTSNAVAAAENAGKFVKAIDAFVIPDSSASKSQAISHTLDKLRIDGKTIAEAKNISPQRESFASLSTNLSLLAKEIKLSEDPVYQQYCLMKKWYWLSNEPAIRNPYYGQTMLTCGKITDTIKP
jgi:Protein of unknown function (DUF3347)